MKAYVKHLCILTSCMRVVLLFFIVFILSCCSKNNGFNVLSNSTVIKHFTNKGEISAITYELNKKQQVFNEYLYIHTKHKHFQLVFNKSVDTLTFEKVIVSKLPFNDVKIIHQDKMGFKLVPIEMPEIKSVSIVFNKPISKKQFDVKKLQIISRDIFNSLFKSEAKFVASDMQVIQIDSDTSINELKQTAKIKVFNRGSYSDKKKYQPDYEGACVFKIRGQTSKSFWKKGFKLELTDSIKRNIPLLGMPKEHDWVLHGPYKDVSLIRNAFAYELSNKIGQYAPRTRFCELIVNNEYLGIYVLIELIKPDKNRVKLNIKDANMEHENPFLVKIDKGSGPIFKSPYKSMIDSGWVQSYYAVYPKRKKITKPEINSIKKEIIDFEKVIVNNNDDLPANMNTQSFVDYIIVNELTRNIDAYRLSAFMHKPANDKITMGPVWDFNYSLGLTVQNEGFKTEGWVIEGRAVPFWWKKLHASSEFRELFTDRWVALRKDQLSFKELAHSIDSIAELNEPGRERNFQKWRGYGDKLGIRASEVDDYESEIELIKDWLEKRIIWMDSQIIR